MQEEPYSPTDAEWAWIAGLFEGEGCIAFHGRSSVFLTVQMTDRDVLERLDGLTSSPRGIKERSPRGERSNHKTMYIWHLCARDEVKRFLLGVGPWLGKRRSARTADALKRLEVNKGKNGWNTHCHRGHVMAGYNQVINSAGNQVCRACRTLWMEENRERLKTQARERRRRQKDPLAP